MKKTNFNSAQQKAISHKEGPAIVLAGPGSGKTTVITHRVKNLIQNEKVPPEKILVVTFTKAAAVHMQHKFMELMHRGDNEIQKTYPVTFGTFHSIFYRILKNSCSYGSDSIVTESMKYDFIKEIIIRLKLEVNSLGDFVQNISSEISRFKGNMYQNDGFEPRCCSGELFEKILKEYDRTLEIEQKLDFEDMLIKCYRLLDEKPKILKYWQEIYQYILIDEFQDINRIQYEIIKMLALPENNLFIVGDDDQSIYGFRGACPEIMFMFEKDFSECKEILLNINYRSVTDIVTKSGNLIGHNKDRFAKDIISGNKVSEGNSMAKTDIRKFRTQSDELRFLCWKIKEYIKRGIKPEDIAILVRNNGQIPAIRDFLKNEKIDTHNKKSRSECDGMVTKDIIAYVKAALCDEKILNRNENLIYILNKPQRYISRQIIGKENMTFDMLRKAYIHNEEVVKNIDKLEFHLKMIRQLNPYGALTYIRYGVGYEKYLKEYAISQKVSLEGLIRQLDKLQSRVMEFGTLEEWIENMEGMPLKEENRNGINIMTMHGAKGLEFRAVFILDANQGIIPSSKTLRERDFQEERRVFYVAVTRAAEILNIYCPMECLGCSMEISMFVEEMLEVC